MSATRAHTIVTFQSVTSKLRGSLDPKLGDWHGYRAWRVVKELTSKKEWQYCHNAKTLYDIEQTNKGTVTSLLMRQQLTQTATVQQYHVLRVSSTEKIRLPYPVVQDTPAKLLRPCLSCLNRQQH